MRNLNNFSNKLILLVLFVVWPLAGLILSINKKTYTKLIITLFTGFIGFGIVIISQTHDLYTQTIFFENDANYGSLIDILSAYPSNISDITRPTINYFVSLFTDNYSYLFAVYGLIIGYFFSSNLSYLLNSRNKSSNFYAYFLLIFLFVLAVDVWNGIGNFRFWTACHVFLYGVVKIFLQEKNSGYLFVLITPLIHFSFVYALFSLFLYFFIGNRTYTLIIVFFASFFINEINYSLIQNFAETYLPFSFEEKVIGYTREGLYDNILAKNQELNWYARLDATFLKYGIIILLLLVYHFRSEFKQKKSINSLFNFSILLLTLGNIASLVPSGGRFFTLGSLIFFFTLVLISQSTKIFEIKLSKTLLLIVTPLFLVSIIVELRTAVSVINIWALLGNPIIVFMEQDNLSIFEALQRLF